MALGLWCWTLVDMQRIQKQIESTKNKGNLMKNVSEMRTKTTIWCAWPHVVQKPEHNARLHLGDARQRPTQLGLARREYKEEAGTSAFRLLRRDFLGSRIRQLLLAHSNTRHGWNVSARDLAKKKKKTRESRKSAKIKSTQTQMKNRQEKHGRHSERIRKA